MNKKFFCDSCGHNLFEKEILQAANPFSPGNTLKSCPGCFEVNTLQPACDIENCWKYACGGYPLKTGEYVLRCHEHSPKDYEIR